MASSEEKTHCDNGAEASQLIQRAQACYGSGDLQGAARILQQAVKANTRDLNCIRNLILILEKINRMEVAVNYCSHALAAASNDAGTYQGFVDLFARNG